MALTQDLVPNLDLISNDNAFLNTLDSPEFMNVPFDQRTLLTRLADGLLVPKPIFHLWTLFALQGKLLLSLLLTYVDTLNQQVGQKVTKLKTSKICL